MSSKHQEDEFEEEVVDDEFEEEVVDDDFDGNDDVAEEVQKNKKEEDDEDEEEEDEDEDAPIVNNKTRVVHHKSNQQESKEVIIVHPTKRVTSEYMTIYEYTMVVGARATHISNGSVLYTDPNGLSDPRDIAIKEINENMCPLSISRVTSPNHVEIWQVNEMVKPLI
jgi:DNA-directed RNA polymerase I, II, and III subunit RPABC2